MEAVFSVKYSSLSLLCPASRRPWEHCNMLEQPSVMQIYYIVSHSSHLAMSNKRLLKTGEEKD